MHLAVIFGRTDIAQLLLQAGAKVKVNNNSRWTAMEEAVASGNRDLVWSSECYRLLHVLWKGAYDVSGLPCRADQFCRRHS